MSDGWLSQVGSQPSDSHPANAISFPDLFLLVVDVAGICGSGTPASESLKSLASGLSDAVGTLALCFPDVDVEVVGFTHERL